MLVFVFNLGPFQNSIWRDRVHGQPFSQQVYALMVSTVNLPNFGAYNGLQLGIIRQPDGMLPVITLQAGKTFIPVFMADQSTLNSSASTTLMSTGMNLS